MKSKYSMMNCKPIPITLDENIKLSTEAGEALKDPTISRIIVGNLITRPKLLSWSQK